MSMHKMTRNSYENKVISEISSVDKTGRDSSVTNFHLRRRGNLVK